jgi:hypothetical protein
VVNLFFGQRREVRLNFMRVSGVKCKEFGGVKWNEFRVLNSR